MLTRDFILWLCTKKGFTRPIGRVGMKTGFAHRFIAGETLDDALQVATELRARGLHVILNYLGENVASPREAAMACDKYIEILHQLDERKIAGSISIKPSQLGLDLSPALCKELTKRVVREAANLNRFAEIDMESSAYTEVTIALFEAVCERHEQVGLAIQSYLYRSAGDLERLRPLHPRIRLVKGAYSEPPSLAFPQKRQVDENYRQLMLRLFQNGFAPVIATHDPRLVDEAKRIARERGLDPACWEFQMLLGIQRELQLQLVDEGYQMRVYVPFGTHWLPYFLRRIAERPANLSFVLRSMLHG